MNKAWKITFADGGVIDGLRLNGNNFVSESEVTEEMFRGKLSRVKIDGPADDDYAGLRGSHGPMELVQVKRYDDGWYFILLDAQITELDKVRSDIEYIAMMAGIDL